MAVKVIHTEKECVVKYDVNNPPDVIFDTNVWHGMNGADIAFLTGLQEKKRFRYRYTFTNFVELASHLADESSKVCSNPFGKFKSCFRKIVQICHAEILPSPEMEFMTQAGLSHYVASAWRLDIEQIIPKVEGIANANSVADLSRIIDVGHYLKLRHTDKESFKAAFDDFPQISKPLRDSDIENSLQWFRYCIGFFFIERSSNGQVTYNELSEEEKAGFQSALATGVGRLFFNHCMTRIRQTVRDGKKVDPNDLYDMLQLILLRDNNRFFVTAEKSFFLYKLNDPESQKVVSWEQFRNSK
jgi:hypothetical protein